MLSKRSAILLRVLCALAVVVGLCPLARPFVADALVGRASTYAIAGRSEDATRYLQRAIWLDATSPAVGSEVAFLAGTTNSLPERKRDIAIARAYLSVHPKDTGSWESLLIAAWRLHDRALARVAAVRIRDLGPTSKASARLVALVLARK